MAEDNETGQLVGFARRENQDGTFFGQEIFVHPDYRGQGTGTRLQE